MELKLNISQIFLPKRKSAKSYVSVFEETVRTDNPVTLFLVTEVAVGGKESQSNTQEFEKLTRELSISLKTTYISESRVNDYTFEKALNGLNQTLSNLANRGVVGWYKKLNAIVGAYDRRSLHVSVAGSAHAMLLRDQEFTEISESLSSGEKPHPLKTFVNFASGSLVERDVVLFGTGGLYNYLSLNKIRQTFSEFSLAEATKELINILQDTPADQAFATFIIKPSIRAEIADEELAPLMTPASHTIIEERENTGDSFLQKAGGFVAAGLASIKKTAGTVNKLIKERKKTNPNAKPEKTHRELAEPPLPNLNPKPSRRGLFYGLTVVGILLAGTLFFFNIRNSQNEGRQEIDALVASAQTSANEAEAALIYNDEQTARQKMDQAQNLLDQAQGSEFAGENYDQAKEKLLELSARLNKERIIDDVEVLGSFTQSPTKIIKTQTGFAALNPFTDTVELADLNASPTNITTLLANSGKNLVSGNASEDFNEPVMVNDRGQLFALSLLGGNLQALSPTSTIANSKIAGVSFYASRAYVLDIGNSQIYRYNQSNGAFNEPSNWLPGNSDFINATDLAIDGNIFVLIPDNILKFTSGDKVNFSLVDFSPPLQDATKIYTKADFEYIYVLEPSTKRIVVLNKGGNLVVQLKSDKFTDLKDFWVDEVNKVMYLLNGSELIRFGY